LTVLDDLTITDPGTSSLTISGNNSSVVFLTAIGTVAISGLTLTNVNGGGGHGGGVENQSTLRLNYVAVSNSVARLGRGVFNGGTTNRTDPRRTPIILQLNVRSLGSATTAEDIAHSRHRDDGTAGKLDWVSMIVLTVAVAWSHSAILRSTFLYHHFRYPLTLSRIL